MGKKIEFEEVELKIEKVSNLNLFVGHGCKPGKHEQKGHGCHSHSDCRKHVCLPPCHCLPMPVCDDRIRLSLAGLTGNLNFQLFRQQGCRVQIEFECADQRETVKGVIYNVGTDFVDLLRSNKTVVTVLTERICSISWDDPHCNPGEPLPPPDLGKPC